MNDGKKSRRRRSSSLLYQEPPESLEHMSDQSALPNGNANWVNAKGEQAALHSSTSHACWGWTTKIILANGSTVLQDCIGES